MMDAADMVVAEIVKDVTDCLGLRQAWSLRRMGRNRGGGRHRCRPYAVRRLVGWGLILLE